MLCMRNSLVRHYELRRRRRYRTSTGMPTEGRRSLSAGRPHVALVALISWICHPMSLAITHLSCHYVQQYIRLTRLIEYYCSMGILKIWSRLAKAYIVSIQ